MDGQVNAKLPFPSSALRPSPLVYILPTGRGRSGLGGAADTISNGFFFVDTQLQPSFVVVILAFFFVAERSAAAA